MAKTPQTPSPAGKQELYWRRFPAIEGLFESGNLPAFLKRAEETCRQLDALIDSGNPRESARARAAIAGYGKSLELLQELRGMAEASQESEDA